jgi:hypothetical protein
LHQDIYIPHLFGEAVQKLYGQHRGWLNAAVHHSIPWPKGDVMVHYDGDDYFLRGLRVENDQPFPAGLAMRCSQDQIDEALRKLYRFSSILGWFKSGYVDVVGHIWSSHATRYSVSGDPLTSVMDGSRLGFDCNYMPSGFDDQGRLALAFWREGLRLLHVHESYSFLSFFKVIESQFNTEKRKSWISTALPTLQGGAAKRVQEISVTESDVGKHIFASGRCAVAHASPGREIVDPDIPKDRKRISEDLAVIRALAQKFIREELAIPTQSDVFQNRDCLKPLYSIIHSDHIAELKRGGVVGPEKVGLNGVVIAVNQWPNEAVAHFTNLTLIVESVEGGSVIVSAISKNKTLKLVFLLDFCKGMAHPLIEQGGFIHPSEGGNVEEAIAFLEYCKEVIANAKIELKLPDGNRISCEVVFPVNIDVQRTTETMDVQITSLKNYPG